MPCIRRALSADGLIVSPLNLAYFAFNAPEVRLHPSPDNVPGQKCKCGGRNEIPSLSPIGLSFRYGRIDTGSRTRPRPSSPRIHVVRTRKDPGGPELGSPRHSARLQNLLHQVGHHLYASGDASERIAEARGISPVGADGDGGLQGRRCSHHVYSPISHLGMELPHGAPADWHGARHWQSLSGSGRDCGSSTRGDDRQAHPRSAVVARFLSRRPRNPTGLGGFACGKGQVLESKIHLWTGGGPPTTHTTP